MKQYYFALAASSIDGKIAFNDHHVTDWTSNEDYIHLQKMLVQCDCILVGNNTYKIALRPLSKRNCVVLSRVHHTGITLVQKNLRYCNPSYIDIKDYFTHSNWHNICILGGTQTYRLALTKKMIQDLYLTIEPLLFTRGLNLFDSYATKCDGIHGTSDITQCRLQSCTTLNKKGSLLLHYHLEY